MTDFRRAAHLAFNGRTKQLDLTLRYAPVMVPPLNVCRGRTIFASGGLPAPGPRGGWDTDVRSLDDFGSLGEGVNS